MSEDRTGSSSARLLRLPALYGRLLILAVVVTGGTIVVLLRQPGEPATNTVFAEDGSVFLHGALKSGLASLWTTYAGYLHVVPRLVALPISMLPLSWSAWLFAVVSSALLVLLACFVYRLSQDVLPSRGVRLVLAACIPLLPVAIVEGLHSATNLHWFLLYGCFWALIAQPTSRALTGGQALVAAAAALSDPLAAVFAPLLAFQLRRGRRGLVVAVAYTLSLALQALAVLGTSRVRNEPPAAAELLQAYVSRVLLSGYLGVDGAADAYDLWGRPVLVLAFAVTVGLLCIGFRGDRLGLLTALSIGYSVTLFIACFAYNWTPGIAPGDAANLLASSRYSIGPTLLLLTAVAAVAQRALLTARRARGQLPVAARAALLAVAFILVSFAVTDNFRLQNARSSGPGWDQEVARAQAACAGSTHAVSLAIAPDGVAVELSCARIRSAG